MDAFEGENGWIESVRNETITEIEQHMLACLNPKTVKKFAQALRSNESLVSLKLNCLLTDAGVVSIIKSLMGNNTLVELSLCNNHCKVKSATQLAKFLKINNTLTSLNLERNELSDTEIGCFSAGLKLNNSLRVLVLNNNLIGDTGTADLADSLALNVGLVELHLKTNQIGKIGAQYLGEALSRNHMLGVLDLAANKIEDAGAISLAKTLETNTGLWSLDIAWNSITDRGLASLATALESNRSLSHLQFWGNEAENSMLIKTALEQNRIKKEQEYMKTVWGNERVRWKRSKLMFVGQGRAGKTATVRSLLGKEFNEEWDSTVGADINTVKNLHERSEWRKDSSSTAGFGSITQSFAFRAMHNERGKSRSTASSVSNVNYASVDEPLESQQSLGSFALQAEQPRLLQPTDENDVKNDRIYGYDETLLLNARGETDSMILYLWDFGGQQVFYSMHHLFLTKYGIYLLVFDMREVLNVDSRATALKYLQFWLSSINIHAPKAAIVLVGTFLDFIDSESDLKEIDAAIREKVDAMDISVKECETEDLIYFPVDNKKEYGIMELRLQIERIARQGELFNQEISMRFVCFLDELLYAKSQSDTFMTLADAKLLAKNAGIMSSEIQLVALEFFHNCGMITYLTATQALKNMIVLEPQWLIDSLSKIIRDVDTKQHKFDDQAFEDVGLKSDLDSLIQNALASRDILEFFWERPHVEFLIDLMKQTMLLSEWTFRNEKLYLIPSLLKNHFLTDQDYESKEAFCYFDFSKVVLPIGVFERLICLVVAHSALYRRKHEDCNLMEPRVFLDYAVIEFETGLKLEICRRDQDDKQRIELSVEDLARSAEAFTIIQSILQKLNNDIMGLRLKWEIFFVLCKETERVWSYEDAKKHNIAPWFSNSSRSTNNSTKRLSADLDSFLENFSK